MPNPTLHPNLAKIAAAYDEIIERMNRGHLKAPAARALIAQLEARDDDGVRWSLDPDSGRWVRKTAFGDAEFDAEPPTYGYRTFDAHDLTPNGHAFDPADRLTYQEVDESLAPPGSLLGATRRLPQPAPHPSTWKSRLRQPAATRAAVLALLAAGVALAGWQALHSPQTPPPAPSAPISEVLPAPLP